MLIISPGPKTLLHGRSLRLASLWKLTRLDSVVFRFAVHDRPLPFKELVTNDTFTYSPVQGVDPSSREMPNGLDDVNLEVDGFVGTTITSADLRSGLFRNALVEEYVVDWRFPFAGAITSYLYTLESVRFNGEDWKGEMSGIAKRLTQKKGLRHSKRCNTDLGSVKCTVNLGPFTFTPISVKSVNKFLPTQRFILAPDNPGDPIIAAAAGDNYFQEGELTWLTGLNAGVVSEIQESLDRGAGTHTITLYLPPPNAIAVADTFTIVAGCDQTFTVCKTRFSNGINFQGYPTLPGSDKALQGP